MWIFFDPPQERVFLWVFSRLDQRLEFFEGSARLEFFEGSAREGFRVLGGGLEFFEGARKGGFFGVLPGRVFGVENDSHFY